MSANLQREPYKRIWHGWLHRARGPRPLLPMPAAQCVMDHRTLHHGNKVIFDFTKHRAINLIQVANNRPLNNV